MTLAALLTIASLAVAQPDLHITISSAAATRVTDNDPPWFAFFPAIEVRQDFFADPFHQDNFVRLQSANVFFASQVASPANGGTYTGSVAFSSKAGLLAALAGASPWTLRIIDGDSQHVSDYSLELDLTAITEDHLRVITIQSPTSGSIVAPNASVTFGVEPGLAIFNQAFGSWYGGTSSFFESFPAVNTSWTPSTPFEMDANSLELQLQTYDEPGLVALQSITPQPGAAEVTSLSLIGSFWTNAQVTGFSVTRCDSIDFNGDGLFPDTADVDDFLSVFGGGACSNDPNCNDLDFNNDGLYPDTLDIDSLLSVFGGGACL